MPLNIYYYSLWKQTTGYIMEEDILNYSPTVMFRHYGKCNLWKVYYCKGILENETEPQ